MIYIHDLKFIIFSSNNCFSPKQQLPIFYVILQILSDVHLLGVTTRNSHSLFRLRCFVLSSRVSNCEPHRTRSRNAKHNISTAKQTLLWMIKFTCNQKRLTMEVLLKHLQANRSVKQKSCDGQRETRSHEHGVLNVKSMDMFTIPKTKYKYLIKKPLA